MTDADLIVNMVFALGAALFGAVLTVRFRQSVILGYILAGIAISPFTPGLVGDVPTVEALANVGIIFLLFSIGAQFSFRDLMRVGRIATVGGTVQVLLLIGLGYLVGIALGLPPLTAFAFGAVISNSSSTVLTKALGERGEADSDHGRISLAWSSVQDLGTIVLVVILSALATEGGSLFVDLLFALGKAALFLGIMVVLGARVLPWTFEQVASLQNRELFILTVATIAIGMAYVSSFFGLSLALGAFVAGVVVGESDLSHHILGEVLPLRDVFAGLFFVSVGMFVNPIFVVENLGLVLITLGMIIVVKGGLSAFIARLAGYPIRTALLTGVALAQSAEFSFLLARVGSDLGIVPPTIYGLLLASAALSIALAPVLHRVAAPIASDLETRFTDKTAIDQAELETLMAKLPRGHAVICGYGRVGRVIGAALRRQGFQFVAIDQDQRVVQRLREHGVTAFFGNAANPVLLKHVGLEHARILVVAIPDPLATRQIVDFAKSVNPRLDIVARTHSEAEREFLEQRGAGEAVLGELELALEMTRRTLRRFGLSAIESLSIVQGIRQRPELAHADGGITTTFPEER